MTSHDASALDQAAVEQLDRYHRRAVQMTAVAVPVLLMLVTVVPVESLSLFERLFPPMGAAATAVLLAGVGSLIRERTIRHLLSGTDWHRHHCSYITQSGMMPRGFLVRDRGVYLISRWTVWSPKRMSHMPKADYVEIAEGPDQKVVLRVPEDGWLYVALGPGRADDSDSRVA